MSGFSSSPVLEPHNDVSFSKTLTKFEMAFSTKEWAFLLIFSELDKEKGKKGKMFGPKTTI